jgi:hypothetical protein
MESEGRTMEKHYKIQWVGQFAVASELIRRDYLTSIPLGNKPVQDLSCESPRGTSFLVHVKSLGSKTYFPLQTHLVKEEIKNLFFIFVHIPKRYDNPLEYYVLSHKKLLNVWKEEREEMKKKEKKKGKSYVKWSEAISFRTVSEFKDKWDVLPD